MTLIRHRHTASVIILMVVIYSAAFLLHDLAHCRPGLTDNLFDRQDNYLAAQNSDGTPGNDDQVHPAQERHHCPFCNGFTGSVTVTILSPPSQNNGKPPLPPSSSHHGETLFSSIARAPPSA